MSKTRIIYLYLVCIITLFMAIGGFITFVTYLANAYYPTSAGYRNYSTYEHYYENNEMVISENEKISNLRLSINGLAATVVTLPIYLYHWKKIQNERKEMEV